MEKTYVIVRSVKEGNRLIRRVNKEHPGHPVAAVSCHQLSEFAKEVVFRERAEKGKLCGGEVLDTLSCAAVLDRIMKDNWNETWFLPKNCLGLSTATEVLEALNVLRLGRLSDEFKKKLTGQEACKEKQLFSLWDKYEKKLRELDKYDEVLLYLDACRVLKYQREAYCTGNRRYYISGDCLELLTAAEREFLELYTAGKYEVFEQQLPSEQLLKQKATFFRCYGMANEVEYVAKKILKEGQPFGEVSVLYSSPEYEPFLQGVFGNRGVSYRLVSAHSAAENSFVSLMLAVLRFAENGYTYEDLKYIVRMPRLRAVYEEDGEEKFAALTKEYFDVLRAGIGWGKQRYTAYIAKQRQKENSGSAEKFLELLEDITGIFGEKVQCNTEVFWRLVNFAKKYISAPLQWSEILSVFQAEAKVLEQLPVPETEPEQIVLLKQRLSLLTVDGTEEQDAVAVARVGDKTLVQERKFIYILGLAAETFGNPQADSAVLSDKERKAALADGEGFVDLREERENRRNRYLYKTIQTMENGPEGNKLYLGYSSFDTINLRGTSPAVAYLRLRELAGKTADEEEYMGYPNLLEEELQVSEEALWCDVEYGEEPKSTAAIPEAKLSATALQTLLSCPLKYYYQRVKWLPNEEYQKRSTEQWLSAADKGTLAHEILEQYCNRWFVKKTPAEVTKEIQEQSFAECVKIAVEEILSKCPFESEAVHEMELAEVTDKCHQYLCSMHEELSAPGNVWQVLACEAELKDVILYYNENGRCNPTDAGAVKLCFTGFMDRVDGYQDTNGIWHLRILDYKSGKKSKVEEGVKEQQVVQHIVYALAAAELAKKAGTGVVVDSVSFLHFFEEKAGDRIYTLTGADIADFPDKVRKVVVEVLKNNRYTVLEELNCNIAPDKAEKLKKTEDDACKYCTYKDICREEKYMGVE